MPFWWSCEGEVEREWKLLGCGGYCRITWSRLQYALKFCLEASLDTVQCSARCAEISGLVSHTVQTG